MRDFRFGFTLASPKSQQDLAETCRTAEGFGFDVAVGVDHIGAGRTSPLLAAVAVANTCKRLRVGSYVLNIAFWNSSFLARDIATAIRLTGDRLELGLGTGVIKSQVQAAGFEWQSFGQRVRRIEETVEKVRELLAKEDGLSMPPLLIGGYGDRMMRLAAEQADIISLGGRLQVQGQPPATLRLVTAAETEDRVSFLRSLPGTGDKELNSFVLDVEVTDDRKAVAARIAAEFEPYNTIEEVLDCPFLLFGTEEEIARQCIENRERYGLSYLSVQRPHMEILGPIIGRIRALAG
jgi:probable F420-dependent oxidoreductase